MEPLRIRELTSNFDSRHVGTIRISQIRGRMPLILARDREAREGSSRRNGDRSVAIDAPGMV